MKQVLILLIILASGLTSLSQINVTASGGTLNATYTTLKLAMDAVNAGTHTGTITMNVTANTTESAQPSAASVVINASGAGSASYTSITVSPTGGAARSISGAATAGFSLIDFNGADNVTFNGLNTGSNTLTISNTTVSATAGTCTIRFVNDASSNTITNCSVLGSSTMNASVLGGTIFFSTATTTGNDNNTISISNIGPVGANLPAKAICSIGTTTTSTHNNSSNTVNNCNIFDYFSADVESSGVQIRSGSNDWTITNNRFYQSSGRTQTTGSVHSAIKLASTNFTNCTISGNIIGYANTSQTGTYSFTGVATSKFYPIDQFNYGSTGASSIQNNTIANISISGSMAGTNMSSPFIGIRIFEGKTNIGTSIGNTIGTTGGPTSIDYTSSSTSAADVSGIHYDGGTDNSISNNSIGGISATNSSSGLLNFYGIRSKGGAAITTNIQSNSVGFASAIINLTATTGAGLLVGILDSTGAANVSSNVVGYLTAYSTSPTVTGIKVNNTGSTSGNIITLNTVNDLASRNAGQVYGIIYNGASTGTHAVHKNFVHSLAATVGATIYGIGITAGLVKTYNNMIRLGLKSDGDVVGGARVLFMPAQPLTADLAITGLRDNSTNNNEIYFNSIYIGGTGVTGSSPTYAFYHTDAASTRIIQNNIFFNARSNGTGTGKHYAVRVGGSGSSPAGLTLNYNDYFVSGTGGVFGSYNGSDVSSLTNWKKTDGAAGSGPGLDANSFYSDPKFVFANGAMPNLHVEDAGTPIEGRGINIASITEDFDSEVRSTLTPVDVGADALNAVATALPVTFLNFSGRKAADGNLLLWTTASESNNTGFEIQRSQDGTVYNKIGFTETKSLHGNSSELLNYAYTDIDKKGLVNYYRLKQIDLDGRTSFSQVVVIKNVLDKGVVVKGLYPNPAEGELFLQVEADEAQPSVLMLVDMLGRLVVKQNIRLEAGYQVITIQTEHLAAGRYMLLFNGSTFSSPIPFVKK